MAYTSGPWIDVGLNDEYERCIFGREWAVAVTIPVGRPDLDPERSRDNANLIVAAPDMYETLAELDYRLRRCLKDEVSAGEAYDSFYQGMVSDALKKARGESRNRRTDMKFVANKLEGEPTVILRLEDSPRIQDAVDLVGVSSDGRDRQIIMTFHDGRFMRHGLGSGASQRLGIVTNVRKIAEDDEQGGTL